MGFFFNLSRDWSLSSISNTGKGSYIISISRECVDITEFVRCADNLLPVMMPIVDEQDFTYFPGRRQSRLM